MVKNTPTRWASLNRVQKPSTASSPTTRSLALARKQIPTPSPLKAQRTLRSRRRPSVSPTEYEAFAQAQEEIGTVSPSPVAVRTRQPVPREEDADFNSIPDYCPPLSTLNERSKFRVTWRDRPLDLSDDPHRHLLHPAEIHLASVLRLSCAVYLTTKRRIFRAKVERSREGLKFQKTEAQKACRIDVNKASKLWLGYSNVGWFDEKFITPHLSSTPSLSPKSQKGYEAFTRLQETGILSPSPVAVRTKLPTYRDDTDFRSIPDYSPSLSTLNADSEFRVQWKERPLDLSGDPHKYFLHPAELRLASAIRLSCAAYLTSKRIIFKEIVERTRLGLKFQKTDAQKACKIDVNKASKLWSAFRDIGWFDEELITPHL